MLSLTYSHHTVLLVTSAIPYDLDNYKTMSSISIVASLVSLFYHCLIGCIPYYPFHYSYECHSVSQAGYLVYCSGECGGENSGKKGQGGVGLAEPFIQNITVLYRCTSNNTVYVIG